MTTNSFLQLMLIGLSAVINSPVSVDATPLDPPAPVLVNDVWSISTRHLPCPQSRYGPSDGMRFKRLEGCRFVPATQDEFIRTLNPAQVTCFFVHGNRMSVREARERGLLLRRLIHRGQAPFRYVIWSWPSDSVHGRVRDARIKAKRADCESYYLSSVLSRMPADANVSLIGFSFGSRTITGGLHLLGGGTFNGNTLALSQASAVRPRAILLAAALPRHWLLPRGVNGLAPLQAEQMFVFFNPRDAALKIFPIVFRPGRPTALGLDGISARQLGPAAGAIRQYNVTRLVGRSHFFSQYAAAAGIMGTVGRLALDSPPR